MEWFKHYSAASRDAKIQRMVDRFGLVSYARWWLLLETVAEQWRDDATPTLTLTATQWADRLGYSDGRDAVRYLEAIAEIGLCIYHGPTVLPPGSERGLDPSDPAQTPLRPRSEHGIEVPNLLKIRDSRNHRRHQNRIEKKRSSTVYGLGNTPQRPAPAPNGTGRAGRPRTGTTRHQDQSNATVHDNERVSPQEARAILERIGFGGRKREG